MYTTRVLSDEVLRAVGRITVAGSSVEAKVAMIHVLLNDNQGDDEKLLALPGQRVRDGARELARSCPDPALGQRALEWLDLAEGVLRERHTVVHAAWAVWVDSGGRAPRGLHGKTGTQVPADVTFLDGMAQRLEHASAEGLAIAFAAARHCGLLPAPD